MYLSGGPSFSVAIETTSGPDKLVNDGLRAGCLDGCAAPRCYGSFGEMACVEAADGGVDSCPRWVEVSVAMGELVVAWAFSFRFRPGFG